jgi:hypothetical protein
MYLYDTNAFMAEGHVCMSVVLICATETRMCDPDEDLIGLDLACGGGLHYSTRLGAFESSEFNHFC